MNVGEFVKKHFDKIVCVLAAPALSALTAAFVIAFGEGKLPHAEDGNAFDTVYAFADDKN